MLKRFRIFPMLVVLVSFPLTTYADITVALTKGFVKKYKDRATIPTSFEVDEYHNKPNTIGTGSDDGDVHIAGLCDGEAGRRRAHRDVHRHGEC